MINVKAPAYCGGELEYILKVFISDFLGLNYQLEKSEKNVIELTCNITDYTLSLNAEFFSKSHHNWLSNVSMPQLPLLNWCLSDDGINIDSIGESVPVLYGKPGLHKSDKHWHLNLDIFGSAFFMLSRYEELVVEIRDKHDRFPATSSVAYKAGFLDRPIVNEYLEILWKCMIHLWPDLKRKSHDYKRRVTCDVDQPYRCGIKSSIGLMKNIGGELIRRKSPIQAVKSTINYFASKSGNFSFDKNYTRIDWMMDVNEKAGNKVAFYFIAGRTSQDMDGCYSLDEPVIRKLLRHIHERGHEVGLHPSYNTYQDANQLCQEADNLRRVMKEEGIVQDVLGGRQHYLRWDATTTAQNWEVAGLDYDSTLYFADQAGFRCGVCYEYQLYDVHQRKRLNIVERPLVMMECTLLSPLYNSITEKEKMLEVVYRLAHTIKSFSGDFTVLWHNSYFDKSWYARSYEDIVNM